MPVPVPVPIEKCDTLLIFYTEPGQLTVALNHGVMFFPNLNHGPISPGIHPHRADHEGDAVITFTAAGGGPEVHPIVVRSKTPGKPATTHIIRVGSGKLLILTQDGGEGPNVPYDASLYLVFEVAGCFLTNNQHAFDPPLPQGWQEALPLGPYKPAAPNQSVDFSFDPTNQPCNPELFTPTGTITIGE
jgi:hypothetical protein